MHSIYLGNHCHNGATESTQKSSRTHHFHRLGEHRQNPRKRKRQRHERQQTPSAVLHRQSPEHSTEKRALIFQNQMLNVLVILYIDIRIL